jgi:hypothetical protein
MPTNPIFRFFLRLIAVGCVASLAIAQIPMHAVDGSGTGYIIAAAGARYDSGIQTMPTVATVLTPKTTAVQLLFCANTNSSAQAVTVTDNQVTPKTYFPGVALPANSATLLAASPVGLPMQGIKWSAATSGINCQVVGVQ